MASSPPPPRPQERCKKTLLELFSGSGNISRAFRERGWNTITLDNDPRCGADLQISILDFRPSEHLPPGTKIDLLWMSPPCTMYSTARRCWGPPTVEQLNLADSMVRKGLQVAEELGCPFLLENPDTGDLKHRGILDHLNKVVVDYCKYSLPFRKRTAIWLSPGITWKPARPLCSYDCPSSVADPVTRRSKHAVEWHHVRSPGRAVIPKELCDEIAAHLSAPSLPPAPSPDASV
jgi:hypothetical protein